ncbi:MAG: hypothetical protein HDS84_06685 [Bacteroidales bacterium]|nr:hypothetical protein [Bacteroidales bacterium]MBD5301444.1 hypothetical protein [Bacteroides sp.]
MEQRYKTLASEILSKVDKLQWKRSNYADSYEVSLGKGTVIIINNKQRQRENPFLNLPLYDLRFLNERGEVVYSIEANNTVLDENKALLEDLYNKAYHTYMQTEETLRSMFDDLSII